MKISDEYIDRFVRQIEDQYQDQSILEEIVNLSEYDELRHANRDFVQIGIRPNLPKKFFYKEKGKGVHYRPLAKSFVETICNSETNFILENASEDAREYESVVHTEELSRNDILEAHTFITHPNYIFLPRTKQYMKLFREWAQDGFAQFRDNKRYVQGAEEIEVKWIPKDSNLNSVILLDSHKIDVIQKRYQDTEKPDWLDHYFEGDLHNQDSRIMTYFGEEFKDDPEEFDFFARVLLTNPEFQFDSNCEIQLPIHN